MQFLYKIIMIFEIQTKFNRWFMVESVYKKLVDTFCVKFLTKDELKYRYGRVKAYLMTRHRSALHLLGNLRSDASEW